MKPDFEKWQLSKNLANHIFHKTLPANQFYNQYAYKLHHNLKF